MATQGPLYPGTVVDDSGIGTVVWAGTGNIAADDAVYASALMGPSQQSHYLKATNYGFSIPSGATIDNILVEIDRKCGTASLAQDNAMRQVQGGTIGSVDYSNAAFWPTSDGVQSYSGLFEGGWTDTNINASDFGWAASVKLGLGGATSSVDYIRITVTYTAAAASLPVADMVQESRTVRPPPGVVAYCSPYISGAGLQRAARLVRRLFSPRRGGLTLFPRGALRHG